jgi:hypothetical protein
VYSLLRRKVKTPLKVKQNLGMVVHICNPSYLKGMGRRIWSWRPASVQLRKYDIKNKI